MRGGHHEFVVYVTGGRQRPRAESDREWKAFEEALLLRVDLRTRSVSTAFSYTSPPEARPDVTPSFVFKHGSRIGHELVLCSQTEILVLDEKKNNEVSNYISLPCFNDVHHVLAPQSDRYLVANTGLDMVVEVFANGIVGREWNALGGDPWGRFSRETDYRKVATTKPHLAHPNYVFLLGNDVWTTRFVQRDAICLTRDADPIRIDIGGPHDGVLHGDAIYFTTVDGHVVEVDATTRKIRRIIDLNAISGTGDPLGWCRGLFITTEACWVGFSRLRPTRIRRNVSWVKHGLRRVGRHRSGPTRLAAYSLADLRLLDEIDLEPHGLNAVFSILPAGVEASAG